MPDHTPLRVATLIDMIPEIGGAEVLAAGLLERYDPSRVHATLITYRYLPPGAQRRSQAGVVSRLRKAGVDVLELDGVSRHDLACWRPLLRRLAAGRFDVLHSHKHGPNLWASILARIAPVPVLVTHEHTWSFQGERVRQLSDRWLIAARSDAHLAVSDADRAAMIDIEGIPADRIQVLPNGIAPVPPPERRVLRAELGIPADVPLLGAISALRPQKDLLTLVRAHARVLERRPEAHLVVIGEGPDRPRIETEVARLGLEASVHLPGFRPEASRLGWELDIALNTSTFEGSSLAIIEHMAARRPIVATDVGGTADLLDGGRAGVLVPAEDPEAVADAVLDLLRRPGRAAELADAAAARQAERYDIDRQVERLQDLYDELHARSGARRQPVAA